MCVLKSKSFEEYRPHFVASRRERARTRERERRKGGYIPVVRVDDEIFGEVFEAIDDRFSAKYLASRLETQLFA